MILVLCITEKKELGYENIKYFTNKKLLYVIK